MILSGDGDDRSRIEHEVEQGHSLKLTEHHVAVPRRRIDLFTTTFGSKHVKSCAFVEYPDPKVQVATDVRGVNRRERPVN